MNPPREAGSPHMSSSEPSMQSGKESHCCLMRTHWPLAHRNWLGRQTAAGGGLALREAAGRDAARRAKWTAANQRFPPRPRDPTERSGFQTQNGQTGLFLGWVQGMVTANAVSTLPSMTPIPRSRHGWQGRDLSDSQKYLSGSYHGSGPRRARTNTAPAPRLS